VVTIISHIKPFSPAVGRQSKRKRQISETQHVIGGDKVAEPLKDSSSSSRDRWPSFQKSTNTPGDLATVRSRERVDLLVHRECDTTYTNTWLEKDRSAVEPSVPKSEIIQQHV